LQLLARAALALGALAHPRMQLLHSGRKPVAHPLELAQVQQHRTAANPVAARRGRRDMRKALGDDRTALALESRDLRAQRGSRSTLIELNLPIDDFLHVVGHTRLLAGRKQFYQCVCER
jgi:hypothetical protein